jgi:hypothetical protein
MMMNAPLRVAKLVLKMTAIENPGNALKVVNQDGREHYATTVTIFFIIPSL